MLVLLPCFWQSRVVASDVLSHSYNAFLAAGIARGELAGLRLVPQSTNVLFDLGLGWLTSVFGTPLGERIAVAACVLVFFHGALAFVRSFGPSDEAFAVACVAVFSNGWVLQQGLMNFYLAAGLSCGAFALARGDRVAVRVLAVPLLLLAWTGNPLPVLWVSSLLAFLRVSDRMKPASQYLLLGAASMMVGIVIYSPATSLAARWQPDQLGLVTGADQLVSFSALGIVPAAFFILAITLGVSARIERDGGPAVARLPATRAAMASAACVAVLPVAAGTTGTDGVLSLVPHRMSLLVAIALVALVATSVPGSTVRRLGVVMAATYFPLLWLSHSRVTRAERDVAALMVAVPAGARVIALADYPNERVIYDHMVDRWCTRRCWSYLNYEPSSGQFRVRADRGNPYVLHTWDARRAVADGRHVVREDEVPIYQLENCAPGANRYCLRELTAGQPNGMVGARR